MHKTNRIAKLYKNLQNEMCQQLEIGDGKGVFKKSHWRKDIGSGVTGVMKDGAIIEKAGLNFSHVEGILTNQMKQSLGMEGRKYSATGISSIIHPGNPMIPIIHMNVRHFELDNGTCWFGGGIDLTPHYIQKTEAQWFHKKLHKLCNKYHNSFYPKYKAWADDYFFLTHRNETRGIGGIFFDRLQPRTEDEFETFLNFTIDIAKAYPELYCEIMDRKRHYTYSEKEKKWQKLRRGRYVEFNLIHDRGTRFGLDSGGNTESIFVSMPPLAEWEYDYTPNDGTPEKQTLTLLKKNIDWININ
ncbi:oxygen-dependent coproporphyrinogen oxidase [Plebeiibacterium marinum]|uniref:coproporphyrinogen oxidase n=1 Tax=Plebeiibacterium marinum TaxID=2992111 RepID=A0AAE3MBK9_9BACT|nr:oxygen-dependent coproporphyrinogen oxidase [Plebeiobacterium marinum]MCW3804718.1 oxygen-dependent coproporphyrinogen oxidase [Plebeiobacterium marinum]